MTVGTKQVSEYNRQYQWHEIPPPDPVAGVPSYKEFRATEPPLQSNQRPTLELSAKEALPEVVKTFGSPSRDLHITREPSFSKKKRVPGKSPERVKVNKSLAKKAGLCSHSNTVRYQSVYAAEFSPKKGQLPKASSPIQSAKSNFVDSKTNLPIGKKPADKKVKSEYNSQYGDPTEAMRHIRDLYKEQMRRKQLELDKEVVEKSPETKPPTEPSDPPPPPGPTTPAEVGDKEEAPKAVYCSPIRADKPKVRGYDLIAPTKPSKLCWQSEYKARFESPTKGDGPVSAYGKRSHPYKQAKTPERVSDLIKPDKSVHVIAPPSKPVASWYSEVLELRKLAHQFKARSHGTHFSPEKMATLAFSNAQLREPGAPLSPADSEESVVIVPMEKKVSEKKDETVVKSLETADTKPEEIALKPEGDLTVTDLEEECPDIENLVIKTKSLTGSPATPAKNEESSKLSKKKTGDESATSTPRTADRTCTLFDGRVSTPNLKNIGSRHHLDRTTQKRKDERICSNIELKTALLAGRAATPVLKEHRHHLDPTTPALTQPTKGTQPFTPHLSDKVQEKLDFTTPPKTKKPWTNDLDKSVLSRASSCTSLASATLDKAKQRGVGEFWSK